MTKIMIVEDSSIVQKMLTKVLEKEKSIQIVGTAKNGAVAASKVEELRPDMIIMDYRMPKQNAPETIKQIMSTNPVPILVLTSAEPFDEKRKEVLDLGAVGFMEKPKNMDFNTIASKLLTQIKTLSKVRPAKRRY